MKDNIDLKSTSIGDGAFEGCEKLALKGLPAGVTSIGYGAFRGCAKLAPKAREQIRKINPDAL